MKQIIQVKNPNWPQANKLAISKPGLGLKLGIALHYQEQIQLAVRTGLELGVSGLQVHPSNRSTTILISPQPSPQAFSARSFLDSNMNCDVTETYSPRSLARSLPDFARATDQERTPRD